MGLLADRFDAEFEELRTRAQVTSYNHGVALGNLYRTAQELDAVFAEEAPCLPAAALCNADFASCTDKQLIQMLKDAGVKGIHSRGGKRLRKADRIALCIEHGLQQPPSYEFLLDFWLANRHTGV